ncbi:hypothetical protein CSAL01_04897 [Colletotrichum salicis]|uniref:Uncharacterized protein n=1 Tax=Colletotrichum salicis TaxID=1209931 RepID=A0A135TC45_9PEZI|nr:hypothetical protein CSAL01_04897 [Colletotrichum salicis]
MIHRDADPIIVIDLVPVLANDCLERPYRLHASHTSQGTIPVLQCAPASVRHVSQRPRHQRETRGKEESVEVNQRSERNKTAQTQQIRQDIPTLWFLLSSETSFRRPYNPRIAFRIRTQFILCFPDGSPRSLIATFLVDEKSDAADPSFHTKLSDFLFNLTAAEGSQIGVTPQKPLLQIGQHQRERVRVRRAVMQCA